MEYEIWEIFPVKCKILDFGIQNTNQGESGIPLNIRIWYSSSTDKNRSLTWGGGWNSWNTKSVISFTNFKTKLLYVSSGVCKIANCQPGTWKQWSGVIKQGACGTQTRIRPQVLTWTTIQKTGSCSGVQTSCPEPEKESRKVCKYFLRDKRKNCSTV